MEHEVRPVTNPDKDRFSILVWYFQKQEREESISISASSTRAGGENGVKSLSYGTSKQGISLEDEKMAQLFVQEVMQGKKSKQEIYADKNMSESALQLGGKVLGLSGESEDESKAKKAKSKKPEQVFTRESFLRDLAESDLRRLRGGISKMGLK